jgi:cephalosporin hydroxylase
MPTVPVDLRAIVDAFHWAYYYGPGGPEARARLYEDTYWMGVRCQKCPLDLWMYQEILCKVRPATVIETGTLYGGSALFLAHVLDLLGAGHVLTIDVTPQPERPLHPRITYVAGSSTDPAVFETDILPTLCAPVLVVLDSDHARDHVRREIALYAPLVTVGSYLIVEDTNVHGHPVEPDHVPGPYEAVDEFLAREPAFERDYGRERFLMTFNPGGYLLRTR